MLKHELFTNTLRVLTLDISSVKYVCYLTPWRKNPKVHHRTHNSQPNNLSCSEAVSFTGEGS
jgi:hypothetical protein